ncbi:MAG: hypothetical protein K6G49_00915 [Candidatus Saccharibacteria bacterium]|nr:hypothetical protein [Candidatus Saccharibacteria bacterium]
MPKIFITINDVIDNCSLCRCHAVKQLIVPGPFECVLGLFCTRTEDPNIDGHQTEDGWTTYRLVTSSKSDPRKDADIPDWCPRLHASRCKPT